MNMNELISFDLTEAAIADLEAEALGLKVNGLDDKIGYLACQKHRLVIVKKRTEVEKRRQELKKESLEVGRKIDSRAKEITTKLIKIEDYLENQQRVIDDEKARIKAEEAAKLKQFIDERIQKLRSVNSHLLSEQDIAILSEESFNDHYLRGKEAFEKAQAEQAAKEAELVELRKQQAEAAKKLEAERVAREKAQAEIIKLQKEEIAKKEKALREQRQKEAQEQAKLRAAQLEKEKAEAEARKKAANKKLYDEVKTQFPTIEACWLEIVRLRSFNLFNNGK